MPKRLLLRLTSLLLVFALVAAACGNDDDTGAGGDDRTEEPSGGDAPEPTADAAEPDDDGAEPDDGGAETADDGAEPDDGAAEPDDDGAEPDDGAAEPEDDGAETAEDSGDGGIDLVALGLWDDGPCDESLDTLHIGLTTVFATGVLTLVDQAQALEASAEAFNARGGANGHCIEVTNCDDNADPNQALECVRTMDQAGVAVTVNDSSTAAQPEVAAGFAAAGIPRFAISPNQADYPDTNAYPFDAGGLGTTIMMPQILLDEGITKMAMVRVDLPATAAIVPALFAPVFGDNGAEFVADSPVPAGTTDYSQFVLAAENAGAEGVVVALGGQEAIQLMNAARDLGSELVISGSLGTFPYSDIADLGDFASQIILNAAIPPATFDDPVVDLIAADLAASGIEELQRENLKSSPMRSWVGLYALLHILRDAGTTDFSRENINEVINAAEDIPMLGLMPSDWTPSVNHPGIFTRTGTGDYSFYAWDPTAEFDGNPGNFVLLSEGDFGETICDSPFGGPCS